MRSDLASNSRRRPARHRRCGYVLLLTTLALVASSLTPVGAQEPPATRRTDSFEPNRHPHSIAIDWVEAMLLAIERQPPAPTVTTWRMWVVASSMFDAHAAYDATSVATVAGSPKRPVRERTPENREIAVDHAAHRALSYVFPSEQDLFDSVLALHAGDRAAGAGGGAAAEVGRAAAEAVIAARVRDGSNALGGFQPVVSDTYPVPYVPANSADPRDPNSLWGATHDANRWTPLRVPTGASPVDPEEPSTFTDQAFLTPHWGAVEGFGLLAGDQFRPPPPPRLGDPSTYVDALGVVSTGDAAYRSQTADVLARSGALSDEHKVLAEFWADGPHTWTPPGHWVQLAVGVSLRDRHTLAEDVALYLALTGGVLDAGIASWEAKRHFDYVRPATAIAHLYAGQDVHAWRGPGMGAGEIDGAEWQPYQRSTFVTPPFAEYVSGHSTFSRAAAEILTAFTGSGAMYDGSTLLGRDYDGNGEEDLLGQHIADVGSLTFDTGPASPVILTWSSFRDAADEAGISRLYGGIHFQDGDRNGREMGRQIGQQAWRVAQLHIDPRSTLLAQIDELVRSGDIDLGSAARWAALVERTFEGLGAGRVVPACRQLDAIVRTAGVQTLVDDVRYVTERVCSGTRSLSRPGTGRPTTATGCRPAC